MVIVYVESPKRKPKIEKKNTFQRTTMHTMMDTARLREAAEASFAKMQRTVTVMRRPESFGESSGTGKAMRKTPTVKYHIHGSIEASKALRDAGHPLVHMPLGSSSPPPGHPNPNLELCDRS